MKNILVIYSSLNGANSNSTKLARLYIDRLASVNESKITQRDLITDGPDHLSQQEMATWRAPVTELNAEQQKLKAVSDELIAEVQAADEIVLALPMYNFGIPSVLKAWIDRVLRAGVTFRYTANGPEGLLSGKKVTVLAARGGMYAGTPLDTQTPYLKTVLGFIGITEVRFIYAEGLNMGEEKARTAFENAQQKIIELTSMAED